MSSSRAYARQGSYRPRTGRLLRLARWSIASVVIIGSASADAQPSTDLHRATNGNERADRNDKAQARRLAAQARTAYKNGDYKRAEALVRAAYALDDAPLLLYNLARALDAQDDRSAACDAYRQYLQAAPQTPQRARILRRIRVLERDHAAESAARREPPPVVVPRKSAMDRQQKFAKLPPTAKRRVLPWIVMGTGLAAIAAGGAVGIVALNKSKQAEAEPEQVLATQMKSEADRLATTANILFIGGGLLTASGFVWGLLGQNNEPPDLAIMFTADSLGVVGQF